LGTRPPPIPTDNRRINPLRRLPDEQQNGSRKQCSHRHVEATRSSLGAEKPLHGGPGREPDKTARECNEDEQQGEDYRPPESGACSRRKIGTDRPGADEPRLGIDPLKGGSLPEPDVDSFPKLFTPTKHISRACSGPLLASRLPVTARFDSPAAQLLAARPDGDSPSEWSTRRTPFTRTSRLPDERSSAAWLSLHARTHDRVSAFGGSCFLLVLIAMGHSDQEAHAHVIASQTMRRQAEVQPCRPA
jgi:hypothetical protein